MLNYFPHIKQERGIRIENSSSEMEQIILNKTMEVLYNK